MSRRYPTARVCFVSLSAALGAVLLACEQQAPPPPPVKPAAKPEAATPAARSSGADVAAIQSMVEQQSAPGGGALPPGHPPISGAAAAPPQGAAPSTVSVASMPLKFEPPESWKSVPPSSGMRKAQYVLPRAAGDTEDGELVLFFFGKSEGGATRDNIERWKGQFTRADGKPVAPEDAKTEEFEASGMKVTLLDVSGTFSAGMMSPGGASAQKPDYRMLAAVVETPGGPWFFKATGPAATMTSQAEAFRKMLAGARYEGQ